MRFLRPHEEREADPQVVEERRQRDANPDRRFEYPVLRVGAKARAEPQLNELGALGWQLVQVVEMEGHLAFYLERELPGPAAVAASEPTQPSEETESQ